ncbi:pilus assembly protein [Marinagarivorans cellulosilyticus]|uniref:Type IV pilus assembly protein PilY1 n=1 Tax=Marinagarivorans cellulosilyticus TaxID=2721545 RepID=A0AAN2BJN3_9GAMM|nr:PilC/PilY family type IV pilus protein [Marinagarivorans cellulosilyticus]BCD97127.1 type IV pilus assembly protein PilY1 [Marinagarivorans cellulosilyticus]
MKFQKLILALALGIFANSAIGDDTDIYVNNSNSAGAPYLMFMMDYRQDLSGPYCQDGRQNNCKDILNTDDGLPLLQALDAMVNGVPGDGDGDGIGDSAAAAASDGDANFDGLRDSAADMDDFEAKKIEALVAVTRAVFEKFDGINVGMMIPNDNGGGTVLRGYQEFQAGDANGAKAGLVDLLLQFPLPRQGNDYHESQPKEMHMEWYQYINGGTVLQGKDTSRNFDGTNTPAPDSSIITGNRYNSPFAANPSDFECTKFYQVYATSGNEGGTDNHLNSEIEAAFNASATSNFESMMDYMTNNDVLTLASGDQKLKSWIIQVGDSAAKADDWAQAAGTSNQYMEVSKGADLVDVQATLEAAFIEALSVSTTFVAASVPVNVFNRIQTLDNFYIALFEAQTNERWYGNIKKFKLKDTSLPTDGIFDEIVDVNSNAAFNTNDGRVKYEALSFWTDASALPTADPDKSEVDGRDGRTVNRGGVGQNIPQFNTSNVSLTNTNGSRQLFIEPSSGSTFDVFNAANTLSADTQRAILNLGASDPISASTLLSTIETVAWARGRDVDDEDNDNDVDESRSWLLGDAIHSRPLALNYGATSGYSESNPNIRLFMGTNDGFFHIFENTDTNGAESGKEIFAFIPRESLPILKQIRDNNGSNRHPYGVDGEPVAFVNDTDNDGTIESGEEVYVYVGMRRGGNSYYALDVSNPNATPSLKWKITQGGDFSELGMTFSTPVVTKVRYESTARDVLIFGGGFDTQNDTPVKLSENPSSALQGAAIYIVDARTGALIWKVTGGSGGNSQTHLYHPKMLHSIPSQVAALDSDQNGITDRLYVGDLSGLVWRIDLPEGNTASHRLTWQASVLADLDDNSEAEDRRMFHAPDVVQSKDDQGSYDGILIATGDRANPLETADENFMFFIKDRNTVSGSPDTSIPFEDDNIVDVTACVTGAESGCGLLNLQNGWKISLSSSGEKGLASPLVAAGKVFFTSYEPSNGSSCEPAEGSGQLYVVNLKDGTAAYSTLGRPIDIGPGIPPAVTAIGNDTLIIPSAGIVKLEQDVPSNDKTKLIEAGGKPMHIIYWRETGIDDL